MAEYLTGRAARRLDALPFGFGRKRELFYHHVNEADRKLGRGVPDLPPKPLTFTRPHKRAFSLWRAAETGDVERVELLLGRGASLDDRDSRGQTALHCAARSSQDAVVVFLTEQCRPGDQHLYVNRRDLKGSTALHLAAGYGSSATICTLLENGADPRMKNQAGRLAADIAHDMGRRESAAILSAWVPPGGYAAFDLINTTLLGAAIPRTQERHTSPMAEFMLDPPTRKPIVGTWSGVGGARERREGGREGGEERHCVRAPAVAMIVPVPVLRPLLAPHLAAYGGCVPPRKSLCGTMPFRGAANRSNTHTHPHTHMRSTVVFSPFLAPPTSPRNFLCGGGGSGGGWARFGTGQRLRGPSPPVGIRGSPLRYPQAQRVVDQPAGAQWGRGAGAGLGGGGHGDGGPC